MVADGSLGAAHPGLRVSVEICRPGSRSFCFFKSKDKFLRTIFVNLQVVVTFPVLQFLDSSNSFFPNGHSYREQWGERKDSRIMVHKRHRRMPLPAKCLHYRARQDNNVDKRRWRECHGSTVITVATTVK